MTKAHPLLSRLPSPRVNIDIIFNAIEVDAAADDLAVEKEIRKTKREIEKQFNVKFRNAMKTTRYYHNNYDFKNGKITQDESRSYRIVYDKKEGIL